MKQQISYLCHCALALLLGAGVYLALEQDTWLHHFLQIEKQLLTAIPWGIGSWLRCFLPDFLWGYAQCCCFGAALAPTSIRQWTIPVVLTTVVGIVWEIMQGTGVAPGTADGIDCFIYFVAAISAVFVLQMRKGRKT